MYIAPHVVPRMFSFTRNQKSREQTSHFIGSVSGSPGVIPGQLVCLRLHRQSQTISNSTQLCSDQWNHQQGFLKKFKRAVKCIPTAFSLVKWRGGKKGMKARVRGIMGFEGKCWVEINARRSFIFSNSCVKVKAKDSSGISKWICRFCLKLFWFTSPYLGMFISLNMTYSVIFLSAVSTGDV